MQGRAKSQSSVPSLTRHSEVCLLPGAGGVVQQGDPHLAVHQQEQLLLSKGAGLLQGERDPQLGVEVGNSAFDWELG